MTLPLTLLCGTDLSESGDAACEAALRMGARLRAHVLLVNVVPPSAAAIVLDDPETGPFNHELARKAADVERAVRAAIGKKLKAAADRFVREGVSVETRVLDGRPAEALRQAAGEAGAAMIILGTHGRKPPARWFVGSVSERIVRESHVPVLIVRDREVEKIRKWSEPSHAFQIVVGCRAEDARSSAIDFARAFATRVGHAAITFGYVYWPPAEATARDLDAIDIEGSRDIEREIVEKMRRQLGDPAARVLVSPSMGRAADALALQASQVDADLLVVGTRGLKGLDLLMEGSFALGAIRHAEVPVLCVPRNAQISAWTGAPRLFVEREAESS